MIFIAYAANSQHNKEWTQVNMTAAEIQTLKSSIIKNYNTNREISISKAKLLLQISQKNKDTLEIGYAANSLGLGYFYSKNFEKARDYFSYAIEMDLASKSPFLSVHYRNLGILFFNVGYINHAIDQFNLGLKASEKGSDQQNKLLLNIGYCYNKIKNYPKAIYYFQKAIDNANEAKNYGFMKSYYENLVGVQLKINVAEAKKNLDIGSTYEATNRSGDKDETEHAYLLQYAAYYLKVKNYKLSESYANQVLNYSEKVNSVQLLVLSYVALAELKLATNQIAEARLYAEKAFKLGKRDEWFLNLKEVTDLLLLIYEKEASNKKPFEVFKYHSLISDSLSRNTLKEYELRNAFEGKIVRDSIKTNNQKKLIAIAYNQHIEKQRVLIWSGVICSILLLVLLIFIFKNYQNKQRINKIIAKENDDLTLQKQKIESHVSELLGVVESARDFVAYSKNEPVFSYINNAGKKLLHIPVDMPAYEYADIFDSGTLEFINTAMKISEMNGFSSGEVIVKLNDGSSIPLLLSIVCHKNEAGEIEQFSMIGQDISNLKNYQEKIMLQNIMLQKVNRELDRFVYSISHDLRAPLISVVGVLEILESEFYPEDTDFQLYLSMLRSGLMNTDDIIKNILSYSLNSRETVKIAEVSISDTIEKTIEQFKETISRKNINVNVVVQELHPFYSDSQRLQTLFKNVLDNAIKYQRPEEKNKKIDVVFTAGEQECILTITDNGIGIEDGFEERIFEMFFRGSNLSSGSGLGLYIVKQITDLLEAKIVVNNISGEKTEFKVVFPNLKSKFRSL